MLQTGKKYICKFFSCSLRAGESVVHEGLGAGNTQDGGLSIDVRAVLIGEHVAQIEHAHAARAVQNLAELVVGNLFA